MNMASTQTKHSSKRSTKLESFVPVISQHRYSTPYMLTDLASIRSNAKDFREALPGVKTYYAVKCFSDVEVLRELDPLVDGYDVASVEEVKKLHKIGVTPSRMTFSNPVKSERALATASKLGIRKFAYQSYNELVKIKKHVKGAEVYLRIKVPDETSALSFSSKFGCDPKQALDLLLQARDAGLTPIGVTFHVGSQAENTGPWENAIRQAVGILRDAEKQGLRLSLLNIGGGFPTRYREEGPELSETAAVINEALSEHIEKGTTAVIAEPGRYMVADSSVIVTSIIGVEERGDRTWLYLDVGTFQAFVEIFELGYFPYAVHSINHLAGQSTEVKTKKYVLTGPSCDSYDTMAPDVTLPADLAIGDKLLIDKTGAYTIVYGSNFNGFKVPRRHFVDLGGQSSKGHRS